MKPTSISSLAASCGLFTSEEIKRRGFISKTEPKPPERCKYCGKTLYYQGVVASGTVMAWKEDFPERCTCEKAAEYWKRYDEKQEREKREQLRQEEKELRKQYIERKIGESGIRKRFLSRTFENFNRTSRNQEAYTQAFEYAQHFDRYAKEGAGIYFEGTCGTGKTHLAAAIALSLLGKGVPVICKTSIDLLGDMKQAFDENSRSNTAEILRAYKQADLLVIDDLGKEQPTEWSIQTLYNILNDRYEDMRPTIITTNYSQRDLIGRYSLGGDSSTATAIISRLRECSKVITMAWEDQREQVNP